MYSKASFKQCWFASEVRSSLGCKEKWATRQTPKNKGLSLLVAINSLNRYIFDKSFLTKQEIFCTFYGILTFFNIPVLNDSYSVFPSPISKYLHIPTQKLVQSSDTTTFSSSQDSWQHYSPIPPYSQPSCCSHLSCSVAHIFPSHTFLPHQI